MSPSVEVLGSPFSGFVRSVRMALEEKGVAYALIDCLPHTPDIDAIHPLGKIPCFRHGELALCESRAIAGYIDRTFPGPRLFPEPAAAAALVEQWVSLLNTAIIPSFLTYMFGYFFPRTPDGQPDRAAIAAATPDMEKNLMLLDRVVAKTGYVAGDSFSYADIDILPVLAYLKDLPESGALFKTADGVAAYLDTHAQRPSFKATQPPPFEVFRAQLAAARRAASPSPAAA